MDFRQLRYVMTVANCQSITKAAKELFISQSALSHYIQNVEKEMGLQLFDRSTTPLSLTYAGNRFLDYAHNMLLQNQELKKEFNDITHNINGKLKIGIPPERAAYMLPRLIPPFSAKYPGIELAFHTGSGVHLVELLQNGSIDFILLSMVKKEWLKELQCQELYKEELVICSRQGALPSQEFPETGSKNFDLTLLNKNPLYVESREHILRMFCEDFFKKKGLTPLEKIELPSNIACFRMATTGMGLAIVPFLTTRLAQSEATPQLYSMGKEPVFWVLNALYRKNFYLSQPEKFFLSLIKEKFNHEFLC